MIVFTDGAIRPQQGKSGLGAVVRGENGQIFHLWSKQVGILSCNEAEYAAAIMALELLGRIYKGPVDIFSDSQIMVYQMQGRAFVKAAGLRTAHAQLRALVGHFERVTFNHIPREKNRLADALANEIVEGEGGKNGRFS